MDNGNGSTHHGNGHADPKPIPTSSAVPQGAPASPAHDAAAAGTPSPKPLVVMWDEEPVREAKLTPNQLAFLTALAEEAGNVSRAAERSGFNRNSHYHWLSEKDEVGAPTPEAVLYREKVDMIEAQACDEVEREIRRRGVIGVLKPQFYQGKVCGTVREFSDVLLIFRAKALMPEKYRERHEVTGAGGKPLHPEKVEHVHTLDLSALSDAELETHNALLEKCLARSGGTPPTRTN